MAFGILHFGHLNEAGKSSNFVPAGIFKPSSMSSSSNVYPQILHLYMAISNSPKIYLVLLSDPEAV